MASYNGTLYSSNLLSTTVNNQATLYDSNLLKAFAGSLKVIQEYITEYPPPAPPAKLIGQLWPRGDW
jgi:hypothetical protein